jgi:hypothetical protein
MESLNKNLQNPYLTMWAASKESLDFGSDFGSPRRTEPPICISHYRIFSPQDGICSEILEKSAKGIDKMNTGFIIRLWGNVGKEGDSPIIKRMEGTELEGPVGNLEESYVQW